MARGGDESGPMLDYAPPARRRGWARVVVGVLAVCLVVGLTMLAADAYDAHRRSRLSPYMRCMSNLRQIGQAMQLYAWDRGGTLPSDFSTLVVDPGLGSGVFACRMTNDTEATGATAEDVLADFGLPGRCSYVYVSTGLTLRAMQTNAIVAFEDPANHAFTEVAVLYADGRVELLPFPVFMAHLKDVAAGVNPAKEHFMRHADAVKEYEKNWRGRMPALKVQGLRMMTELEE